MTGPRRRHLLVIGGQRCGTTYLHTLLDAHPEITMARPARPEPKVFLSGDLVARGRSWYLDTYFGHATSERLLGEKSTSYLEVPAAAEAAAGMLGEAAIVVLLRDPVARAVSNWRFSTDNGFERRPLETALREGLSGPAAWDETTTSVSPFAYLERGRYAEALVPWLEAFPASVHVVFLQDLLDDPAAIPALYERLGVDPSFRPRTGGPVNESRHPVEALPPDLVGALREYFEASDRELAGLLGRDLPWRLPVARTTSRGVVHA